MGRRRTRELRTCEICGGEFETPPCLIQRGGGRFCSKRCYGAWLRTIPYKRKPLAERFWSKVNKNGPEARSDLGSCWLWTGAKNGNGYGVIGRGGGTGGYEAAHRVSWELHNGTPPGDAYVCHRCDVPLCVNPAHLWLGDNRENQRDAYHKGRSALLKVNRK